jgi:PST family polysaccharide transporter
MANDNTSQDIARRALGGVAGLVARDVGVKLLAFGGWIALARLLDPATFALFAVASFVLSIFGLFSQLGLGAAAVRERQGVQVARLDALFTVQMVGVGGLALLMVAAAPLVAGWSGSEGAGWLTVALALALVLLSLRSVPTAMRERELAYGAPVLADIVTQASYWGVAIALAWAGWGAWSAVAAVTISSGLGTAALIARTRWRPRLNWDWTGLRDDTMFGLMYASQALAHSLKYAALPLLGGAVYGGAAVGYLTWAHQIAALPGQLSNLVGRVNYPALSYLQDELGAFARLAGASLKWTCKLLFPLFALLVGLAPQVAEYIYGAKWLPASSALAILSVSMAISSAGGVLLPALYSLGRGKTGTTLSMGWVALTWLAAGVLAMARVGFEAVAWAYLLASMAALAAMLYTLRRLGWGQLVGPIALPGVSAVALALGLWVVGPALVHDLLTLLLVGGVGMVAALAANLWPERSQATGLLKAVNKRREAEVR